VPDDLAREFSLCRFGFGSAEAEPIIERGDSFVQLPIPCGGEGESAENCSSIAERFCDALGYGPPIDFVDADGELHVIRCKDEI